MRRYTSVDIVTSKRADSYSAIDLALSDTADLTNRASSLLSRRPFLGNIP